jgi:hypothetical protein
MSSGETVAQAGPAKSLLALRIIWGTLIQGMVIFAVIAAFARKDKGLLAADPFATGDFLVLFGLGFAALELVLSFVVPPFIARSALAKVPRPDKGNKPSPGWEEWPPNTPELWGIYQTAFIVRAALLEGAGFFNLIAFLTSGSALSLLAAAVILVALIMLFPTQAAIRSWVGQATFDFDVM